MEYTIISVGEPHVEEAISRVQNQVNKALKNGWELYGDLKVIYEENTMLYNVIQAMVKNK